MNFEKQERQSAQLEIGIFEGRVVNVNPTTNQLYAWRGWEKKVLRKTKGEGVYSRT